MDFKKEKLVELETEYSHEQKLLKMYHRHRRIIEEQIATYGKVNAPSHLLIQQEDFKGQINQSEEKLKQLENSIERLQADQPKDITIEVTIEIEHYRKLKGTSFEVARVELDRGLAFGHANNLEQAIMSFNNVILLTPENDLAYYNRGIAFRNSNQHKQAIRDFTEAIKLNPAYAVAYNDRGLIYAISENYEQAINDFTEAIKLNPHFALPYMNRGVVYQRLNNLVQAFKDLRKADELLPNFGPVYFALGKAYQESGDQKQAIESFEKYLNIFPDAPNREIVVNALEKMKSVG